MLVIIDKDYNKKSFFMKLEEKFRGKRDVTAYDDLIIVLNIIFAFWMFIANELIFKLIYSFNLDEILY